MSNKKNDFQIQAEKKVTKAVGVFAKAIKEVEQAQEILKAGVQQDSTKISVAKNKINQLNAEINRVNADKTAKGEQMKANAELLVKLADFKA